MNPQTFKPSFRSIIMENKPKKRVFVPVLEFDVNQSPAEWWKKQIYQLGVSKTPGQNPTPADIKTVQKNARKLLKKLSQDNAT